MNYLQKKKLAFMSIVNKVKGFIRTITGALPLTLEGCVDDESIIDYKLYGQSVQNGTPAPATPVEVESVGEKSKNLFTPDVPYEQGFLNASGNGIIKNKDFPNIHVFTIAVKPNTTYSYNGVVMNNTTYALLNSNMEYLGKYGGNISSKQNITFETTSDTAYVQICSPLANFQKGTLYFNEGEQYIEEPYYEGYKIPIKVSGKNIANFSIVSDQYNVKTEKIAPNIFKVTKTNNEAVAYGQIETYLEIGKTYTLFRKVESEKPVGAIPAWKAYNAGSVYIYNIPTYYTFTATQEKFILGLYPNQTADLKGLETTFTFMLVEGSYTASTFPDYEPYHEPITTNIYLDEPLRKVGDYADYVDLENGKVVRNVKESRLNKCFGTYTWIGKKGVTFNPALDKNYDHRKALCNRNSRWTANGDEKITMWVGVSSRTIYWIGILDYLGLATVTEMNEWLTNNPTYVFYGTDIPTETPITLPNLPTFRGTSIISADTTIQPSNAEIEYYSNVKE